MEENGSRENEEKVRIFQLTSTRRTLEQDFGKYETRLLFVTQLAYIPVAASMLMTTFSEPSKLFCDQYKNTSHVPTNTRDFQSVLLEMGFACNDSSTQLNTYLSSLLMWGALAGSFFCGVLSDSVGRKPVFIGCLAIISLMNLLMCFTSSLTWYQITVILLTLGFASGGYMVTNFVILTEAFELARSRLLVVSLNGWSFSMIVTAAMAWFTGHWLPYHLSVSVIAICMAFAGKALTFESCRWLSSTGKYERAKQTAVNILTVNGANINVNEFQNLEWFEMLGFTPPVHVIKGRKWTALFSNSKLLKHTLVMFYCFLASSVVSFGFYFSLDVLPGNRYVNLGFMGFFKFALGFSPFLLSNYMTKRMIVITSICICCCAAILVIPIQYLGISSFRWMISVLSLVIAAGIDPTWKINHLYSAELFPTSVRSMGRGVCNAGGRLGSVIAPMIIFLRSYDTILPNSIFCGLLLLQLVVVVVFLPSDDDKNANEMDDE